MSANDLFLAVEEERIVPLLKETTVRLDWRQGQAVLDFSAVHRINSDALKALEDLAQVAEGKAVKIVLRGVTVDVYKVLKLIRMTHKVSFLH